MKTLLAILFALLSLSACVVAPVGPPAYATVHVTPPVRYIAPPPGIWMGGWRAPHHHHHHHGGRGRY